LGDLKINDRIKPSYSLELNRLALHIYEGLYYQSVTVWQEFIFLWVSFVRYIYKTSIFVVVFGVFFEKFILPLDKMAQEKVLKM